MFLGKAISVFDEDGPLLTGSFPPSSWVTHALEVNSMKTTTFLLTLGAGMVAGGAAVLMLPEQCAARRTAQKAVNAAEEKMMDMMS